MTTTTIRYYLPFLESTSSCLNIIRRSNQNVIVMLPGQSLPPEMFYGLPIYPDRSSIADKITVNGFDVAYLDPVGYGRSIGMLSTTYFRDTLADQIVIAIDFLKEQYQKIFLLGFCSTTAPVMIAATKRDIAGIVIQSPMAYTPELLVQFNVPCQSKVPLEEKRRTFSPLRITTFDSMVNERINAISDTMLGYSNKVKGWEEMFLTHLSTFETFPKKGEWYSVTGMRTDLPNYVDSFGNQGWISNNITCPITVLKGSADTECNDARYDAFIKMVRPILLDEIVVQDGTHFMMWDNTYDEAANALIGSLNALAASS